LNTTIVICSANRPDVLAETVDSVVRGQSLPPREIIVSVFNQKHVAEKTRAHSAVRVVLSDIQGTSVQRNMAAKLVRTPYTLFLDDDVELAHNFIESMERLLEEAEDAVGATGFLVVDGAQGGDTGLDRKLARSYAVNYVRKHDNYDHEEGQNLFVRTRVFDNVLFDEKLPLYGWLEDLDFATNCLRYGRIIMNTETCFAHLATPTGRTSGLRYGYSQIVNPFYLWRKNGKPGLTQVIFGHWLLHIAYNYRRALITIPSDRNDRRGRFRGNMIALRHLLARKVDPSYILKLSSQLDGSYSAHSRSGIPDAGEGSMRVSVIVCSIGRPAVLNDTVQSLLNQTYAIDEILIGAPSTQDVMQSTLQHPTVRLLLTSTGLTVQRNACLSQVRPSSELIAFVDDDMEFSSSYMAAMVALFEASPDLVASSGTLLYDGGIGECLSRQSARQLCAVNQTAWREGGDIHTSPRRFAYGCNMVYRASAIRDISFDERLPLYGWLEDSDFSHASTRGRRTAVTNCEAYAVHLGWRGGRIGGRRLGFSQIVNPFYLWQKSKVFSLGHIVVQCWLRCLVGNILGLVFGEPIEDRPGRLHGNALGFLHLLSGRVDPQHAWNITTRSREVTDVTALKVEPRQARGSLGRRKHRKYESSGPDPPDSITIFKQTVDF
jgi:glycosyltransferase involved in cell wall biosynthesis